MQSVVSPRFDQNPMSRKTHDHTLEGSPVFILKQWSRRNCICRSPSSPAARQLAAELDELRRLGNESQGNQVYTTASLPRGLGHKASSTLALPTKKYSMTTSGSAVESDDEVARGGRATATSSRASDEKPLKRDRTRSSIRNLFMRLTRSTSQDQNGGTMLKKSGTSRCRSPSSPAARQLAAELDELRRLGNESQGNQVYTTASLPRGLGHKASSTLALPTKKYSMTTSGSAVESDDEVARGGRATATSSRASDEKPLKRDRTRSSIRNLFMRLTRSTSQDQNGGTMLKKSGTSRSASSVRFTSDPLAGGVELFPTSSQFVDWKSEQLAEWMGEIGFAQYVPEVLKYVRSGRHFLNMNSHEYEMVLGIKNPLHRKRLNLLLRRIENDASNVAGDWDIQKTQKWLEDIGLPQYKEVFCENLIDGLMFSALTAADLVEMRVLNAHHFLCICRSIQYLKMVDFKTDYMVRTFDESIVTSYPKPEAVVHWTHAATCEWLRKIDLAEFTPNMLCAGTPGALMVGTYGLRANIHAETLAEILQMPPHKTLLRRHLTTHFNQLLGQKIVAEKRDALAVGGLTQLVPGIRIKVTKRGLSLSRKKSKSELWIEPNELLCPEALTHKYPSINQT
ncbi:hypothetical protein COOONC_11545 [Cooperia oncophora]